jgi:energy-coupling factor transporter ATP-binding protein EcfA2
MKLAQLYMFFMRTNTGQKNARQRLQLVVAVLATATIFVFGEPLAKQDTENEHLSLELYRY